MAINSNMTVIENPAALVGAARVGSPCRFGLPMSPVEGSDSSSEKSPSRVDSVAREVMSATPLSSAETPVLAAPASSPSRTPSEIADLEKNIQLLIDYRQRLVVSIAPQKAEMKGIEDKIQRIGHRLKGIDTVRSLLVSKFKGATSEEERESLSGTIDENHKFFRKLSREASVLRGERATIDDSIEEEVVVIGDCDSEIYQLKSILKRYLSEAK